MKINYTSAVAAGQQARQVAFNDCVEDIRLNTELSVRNIQAYRNGAINEKVFRAISVLDLMDKERIMHEYTNLIYPNTILGIVEQVLVQMREDTDWPV